MNKLPDRAQMRREYLLRKAGAKAEKVVAYSVAYGCGIPTAMGFAGLCIFLSTGAFNGSEHIFSAKIGFACFALFLLGSVTFLGHAAVRDAIEKDRSIPYVPPVREQIENLPAEEILVRSSQAAAASSEELLRAAGTDATNAVELLRASAGKS